MHEAWENGEKMKKFTLQISHTFRVCALLVIGCFAAVQAETAKPFVHQLFTSYMVLQRDAQDPVWGWTTSGETVTVTVKDENGATAQVKTAVADADGRWQVDVGPFGLVTSNAAYSVVISAPSQTTVTLTDVLIGDVLLCSGQSNMAGTLNSMVQGITGLFDADIADSTNYPNIRCFTVPSIYSLTPQETLSGGSWIAAATNTVGNFTAAGYFTAREIYKQQEVPIGILCSAYGGTLIKCWTDKEFVSGISDFDNELFLQPLQTSPLGTVCGLYNAMIAPLSPFRVRATVWYQGESDSGTPEQYRRMLPGLMSVYRENFNVPDLPFIIIQIANYATTPNWAGLRESQLNSVIDDPNSRFVTTMDLGCAETIHPTDKQDVGLRASWAAASLIYGQNVVDQGPVFTGAVVSGTNIVCAFSNVGGGLMVGKKPTGTIGSYTNWPLPMVPVEQVVGGSLNAFELAGTNGVFYAADAVISGSNTVTVSCSSVPEPVSVRYDWASYPDPAGNLYNMVTNNAGAVVDGIPAASFRNDPVYKLNVNNGSGTAYYDLGATAPITASTLAGQIFDHWSGDTNVIADVTNASTTVFIDQPYTSVRANYLVTNAPTGLAASPLYGEISLSWTAMSGVYYTIKRSTNGVSYTELATVYNTTHYTDVVSTGTYYYVISATGPEGEGPYSSPVEVTTLAGTYLMDRSGWTASASNYSNNAGLAIDGDISTRWAAGIQTPGQWFQVDMGSVHTVYKLTMDAGASANDYPRGYEVYLSKDGVDWGDPVASGSGSSALITVYFDAQSARYVRVVQTGSTEFNWWSIYEFNLYETESTDPAAPVAYYPFDGDFTDSSGSGNNGTASGSAFISTTDVAVGSGSLSLNGSDGSYVSLSNRISFAANQPWSVAFWARRGSLDNKGMVLGCRTNVADFIWLNSSFGGLRFRSSTSASVDFSSPQDDELHHYALVADGSGSMSLYIDGVLSTNRAAGNTSFVIDTIGSAYSGTGYAFNGVLDDVQIYDSAVGSTDIAALYKEGANNFPVANQVIAVDVQYGGSVPAGFVGVNVGDLAAGAVPPSYTVGTYTMTFAGGASVNCFSGGSDQIGYNMRGRSPVISNSVDFTQFGLMAERVAALGTAGSFSGLGNGLYMKIGGLEPNTAYRLQVWGVDYVYGVATLKNGTAAGFDATHEPAGYTRLPELGDGYTVSGSPTTITNNNQYSISGVVISDSDGTIIYKSVATIDGSGVINGFTLSTISSPAAPPPEPMKVVAVDLEQFASNPTQAGFSKFVVGDIPSGTNSMPSIQIGSYTVTVSAGASVDCFSGGSAFVGIGSRARNPYIQDSGDFTQSALMMDRSTASGIAGSQTLGTGNGLYLKIEGLEPNTLYRLQAWGVDQTGTPATLKTGSVAGFDATTEQAGYTSLRKLGGYTISSGQTNITNNAQYSVSGLLVSDSNGTVIYKSIENFDGSGILNGFTLYTSYEPRPLELRAAVDVGVANSVESGFSGWVINPSDATAVLSTNMNGYTFTMASGTNAACLSGVNVGTYSMRVRSPNIPDSGDFTQNQVMEDRVVAQTFARGSTATGAGGGLYLKIGGLAANTQYRLQVWGVDLSGGALKNGTAAGFDATYEATTGLTKLDEYVITGNPTNIVDNNQYSISGTFTSDSNGTILYKSVATIDGNGIVNGFALYKPISFALAPDTTAPDAPTGLVAIAGDGSVALDWDDNIEGDLGSYTVYRSATSGSGYAELAADLSSSDYTDSSAVNGTTYYYVVTATDTNANESALSTEVSATPVAAGPVESPTVVLSASAAGSMVFSWADGFSYNILTNGDLVNGSWGVYTNVSSPYTNAVGGDSKLFFRLQYQE